MVGKQRGHYKLFIKNNEMCESKSTNSSNLGHTNTHISYKKLSLTHEKECVEGVSIVYGSCRSR